MHENLASTHNEPAPPVFADAAENNGESGSRTWITSNFSNLISMNISLATKVIVLTNTISTSTNITPTSPSKVTL
ncbi:hypothetical protein Hanom_Chr16g01516261 [Helianthus anomalus]